MLYGGVTSRSSGCTPPMPHAAAGLAEGDGVDVRSEHGVLRATVGLDLGLRPGVVSVTHGHEGSSPGRLTSGSTAVDPLTAMPHASSVPVSLRTPASPRGDLGHRGQRPADRASDLRRLGVLDEGGLVDAGHPSDGDERDLGDRRAAVDGRSVTVASVWTESGGLPAFASMLESAIEKQAACAAAISCSGFEPGPSSKRDLNV